MTSALLCEIHGYTKYVQHHRRILSYKYMYKHICRPVGSYVQPFRSIMCKNMADVLHTPDPVFSKEHIRRRMCNVAAPHISKQRNWKLYVHRPIKTLLLNQHFLSYSSISSDSDWEHAGSEADDDDDFIEEIECENTTENVDDLGNKTSILTEFETEWDEIKTMLRCSDEKMLKLISRYPRLKNVELLKKVKLNMRVLNQKGVSVQQAFSLLLSSKGVFLQVSENELRTVLGTGDIGKYWYRELSFYMEFRLKDYKDIEFLSELLNAKHELVVKLNFDSVLEQVKTGYRAVLLKEKIDFLLSEGLSKHDLAYNLEILIISMNFIGRTIDEMKATVGHFSIGLLKSKYYTKLNRRYRSTLNKVTIILDCSITTFSKQQRKFLNNINQTESIDVLDYLLDMGIDKEEIIKNPYVLGPKLDDVRDSFEKHADFCDTRTLEGQRKLLNLIVYHLEYGDSVS